MSREIQTFTLADARSFIAAVLQFRRHSDGRLAPSSVRGLDRMTPETESMPHPAPHAGRVKRYEIFFGLCGGPLAWLLQSSAGYALASEPCFRDGVRAMAPPQWTGPAMMGVTTAAVVISLLSLWVSWRAYQRTQGEVSGEPRHSIDVRTASERFLALWGALVGGLFAIAATMTYVAFLILPRCAG